MERQHPGKESVGSGGKHSKGSSWALRSMEQEQRRGYRGLDRHETQLDSHVTSSKGERTVSYVLEGSHQSDQDREMESLRR